MNIGDMAPSVRLTGSDGTPFALHDRIGSGLIVYFYPKADTTGCTREAQDFSVAEGEFAAAGFTILGVSRDTPAKLARFAAKHDLTVPLASDEDGSVCEAFGTWGEKQMYGRTYMGIERATFAVAADGRLTHVWRKVKVPGHAAAVLAAVRHAG
ncbi:MULTISPECIES: peroxiredoxin [unclassified Sphingomonas]|uniref:peroxiredoxin n=1 Tax=unclassified Sphingomonas TaxID=196159 RepID=UPI0006F8C465|nr:MULTISPECIES: peroxiredoxin [unclassified Sphingomonas]KQN06374.1 alkyl hydroperoxide reductase [Sphingomonas sp. Leaf25]